MNYKKELCFVEKLFYNNRLKIRYIKQDEENYGNIPDLEFHRIFSLDLGEKSLFEALDQYCKPNIFYHILSLDFCNYILFRMPDTEIPTIAFIGPYTSREISKNDVLDIVTRYQIPPQKIKPMEVFYENLLLIKNESDLFTTLYALGECMWGSLDNFTVINATNSFIPDKDAIFTANSAITLEESYFYKKALEERYEIEQKLMIAVGSGNFHKAETILQNLSKWHYEQRHSNALRNMKNYLIVSNTVYRLAVAMGGVHPIHIDELSSSFAQKIESLTSERECQSFLKEMVRKYCLLVQNYSLKNYSPLIQKVITHIDFDLTVDLSLKAQAKLWNANPSYLSNLFKKETGMTLTEYVNMKRMERAIFLLNTTNLPVQTIASHCGMTEVNYFTKLFKKKVGMTPTEYRVKIGEKSKTSE